METKSDGGSSSDMSLLLFTFRNRSTVLKTVHYALGTLMVCVVLVCMVELIKHDRVQSTQRSIQHRKVLSRSESVLLRSVEKSEGTYDVFISVKTSAKVC